MLFRLAWRNIFRNKRRSLISLFSVVFAVVCAVFLRSIQYGAYDNMIDNVAGSYLGYVQVHSNGYWAERNIDNVLEDDWVNHIDSCLEVSTYSKRVEGFALATYGRSSKPVAFLGLDAHKEAEIIGLEDKLVAGSSLQDRPDGIWVAINLARSMNMEVGDSLILMGQGFHGSIAAGHYPVVGIVDLKLPELNKRTVIAPLGLAREFFVLDEQSTSVVIQPVKGRWKETQQHLQATLDSELTEVLSWEEMLPELIQLITADKAGGTVVLIILYMIITLGLFGTVLMLD